jgi:Dolichyl-phosphate-mannose-protein mannosyltransferase
MVAKAFRCLILALLAFDIVQVFRHLVFACGGLDSAGYLGAAQLFLSGRLTDAVPIARVLPFPNAIVAAAPLGFVPASLPYEIAPRFPPGLPALMAVALAVGGRAAPFLVPAVAGIAAILLCGLIARDQLGSVAGALAAALLAANPVFLDMAIQPMSDVPATFWVLLAAYLAWRPQPRPALAGLAAGMALLTRPPLALFAVALAVAAKWRTWRQPVVFASVVALFVAALIAMQWRMYGHPFTSGYGTAGGLFASSAFAPNSVLYAKWLLAVHTPLMLLLVVAGVAAAPGFAWRAGAALLAVATPYLFYAPRFEDWEILRFVLPGLPFLLMVCAAGTVLIAGRSHPARARAAASIVAVAATIGGHAFVASHHAFDLYAQEKKYPMVADWFAAHTPQNAVAMASLHSGSLRYYTGRAVVRVDAIPDADFRKTLEALQRAAFDPYLVVEQGDELEAFEHGVRPDQAPRLSLEPLMRIRGVYIIHLRTR